MFLMKTIQSTKAKIIAVIVITCVVTAIAAAIILTRPQLYTVRSSYIIPTLPIRTSMDINKYVIVSVKDKDLIDSVSKVCNIPDDELRGRITATIENNKSIGMAVSAETPEKAAEISEHTIDLLNDKIAKIVKDYSESEIAETEYTMEAKKIYVDSLRQAIHQIDSMVACQVSKTGSRKDQLIEHKILLEKNPDYIFASKLMEKFANDYGNALSSLNENKIFTDNDKNYISVIKSANPKAAYNKINKPKSLIITAFLSFLCSICLVVFWNMLASRKKTSNANE